MAPSNSGTLDEGHRTICSRQGMLERNGSHAPGQQMPGAVEGRGAVRQASTWGRRLELLAGVDAGGDAHTPCPRSIGRLQSQHERFIARRGDSMTGSNIVWLGV